MCFTPTSIYERAHTQTSNAQVLNLGLLDQDPEHKTESIAPAHLGLMAQQQEGKRTGRSRLVNFPSRTMTSPLMTERSTKPMLSVHQAKKLVCLPMCVYVCMCVCVCVCLCVCVYSVCMWG